MKIVEVLSALKKNDVKILKIRVKEFFFFESVYCLVSVGDGPWYIEDGLIETHYSEWKKLHTAWKLHYNGLA